MICMIEVRGPRCAVRGPTSEVRGLTPEVEKSGGRRSELDPRPSVLGLEQITQAQLHVAPRVVLPGDPAEIGLGGIGLGAVPVRVVREIEDLRPELHAM